MKKLIMLLVLVVFAVGCMEVSNNEKYCNKIETQTMCKCLPTDKVPESLKDKGIVPKCFCMCEDKNGTQFNVSIMQSPDKQGVDLKKVK